MPQTGFDLKEDIKNHLINKNISVFDLGPYKNQLVDYPDYAKKLQIESNPKKVMGYLCAVQGQVWQ